MKFDQAVVLQADVQSVWGLLWNVERLATCIPGCQGAEPVEPGKRYRATVTQKVGPFQLKVPLEILVQEAREPTQLKARATGQDPRVATRVTVDLDLQLRALNPEQTELVFQAQVSVLGKLATLGQGMIRRKAEQVLEAFTQNLAKACTQGAAREAI